MHRGCHSKELCTSCSRVVAGCHSKELCTSPRADSKYMRHLGQSNDRNSWQRHAKWKHNIAKTGKPDRRSDTPEAKDPTLHLPVDRPKTTPQRKRALLAPNPRMEKNAAVLAFASSPCPAAKGSTGSSCDIASICPDARSVTFADNGLPNGFNGNRLLQDF
jgi:hypothetical protein